MRDNSIVKKPVTVLRYEFFNQIVNLINNSELPAFIIEPILRDILEETHKAAKKQEQNDIKAYQEAISIRNESDNDEN